MNLRDQLTREEGRVAWAYPDSLGFLTIGVGHLIDKRKGGRLRDTEIDLILDNDITEMTGLVDASLPWAKQLNDPRRAVLIGMAFQLGMRGLLGFQQTLAAVRDGHYDHAGEMMLQSAWAKQTPERVDRLRKQMASGAWQ